jgi:hypothetical protein
VKKRDVQQIFFIHFIYLFIKRVCLFGEKKRKKREERKVKGKLEFFPFGSREKIEKKREYVFSTQAHQKLLSLN